MYEKDEKLILVDDHGKKDSPKFLAKGTELEFVKVIHNENDLSMSMIIVKIGERVIPMKETMVKPVNKKKIKTAFVDFNKTMMLNNPVLRKYHPNFFLRYYYRVYYFFKERFGDKD